MVCMLLPRLYVKLSFSRKHRNMEDKPDFHCVLSSLHRQTSVDACMFSSCQPIVSSLYGADHLLCSASTLTVDVSAILRQLTSSAALAGTAGPGLTPKAKLAHARALLAVLLTFGISEGIDSICAEGLSIAPHTAPVGIVRYGLFVPLMAKACTYSKHP